MFFQPLKRIKIHIIDVTAVHIECTEIIVIATVTEITLLSH